MGKIYTFLILVVIPVLSPKLCLSELKNEYNFITDKVTVVSVLTHPKIYYPMMQVDGYFDEMKFFKEEGSSNYLLRVTHKYDIMYDKPSPEKEEIIINGISYRLGKVKISGVEKSSGLTGDFKYIWQYSISDEIIRKIKKARYVTLKFVHMGRNVITLSIPPLILDEWKKIIKDSESPL